MKINLLVINDSGLVGGGAENRIRLLLNYLKHIDLLNSVHVLCSKNVSRTNSQLTQGSFIKLYFCDNKCYSSYKTAVSIIKTHKIDLVSAHNMLEILPFPLLAAKKAKIPVIWFAHDYWPLCAFRSFYRTRGRLVGTLCPGGAFVKCTVCTDFRTSLRMALFRWILNKADIGVAPSEFVKRRFEEKKVLTDKWKIVTPWIDTDNYTFCNKPLKALLLFVGPLVVHKGIDIALKALALVKRQVQDVRMIVAGPGQEDKSPDRKRVNELAIRLGIYDRLEFVGYKEPAELKKCYEKALVYLCPSLCLETFGLNWAEAMACGVVVVASDIGSIPELSRGQAIIVPAGSAEKFAEKVTEILSGQNKIASQDSRRKMADFASNEFRVDRAVRQIMQIYEQLSNNRKIKN